MHAVAGVCGAAMTWAIGTAFTGPRGWVWSVLIHRLEWDAVLVWAALGNVLGLDLPVHHPFIPDFLNIDISQLIT